MSRYIDSLPTPAHVEPKKLVVLSAPRTGTHGLYSALKLLGFKPYHMVEVVATGPPAVRIMCEGAEGELGRKQRYTRKEFDKWFANYDIIIEMPFFMLQSTLSAYPDAKFLLVERSPEKWANSFENTIGTMQLKSNTFPRNVVKYFDGIGWEFNKFGNIAMELCTKGEGMTEKGKKNLIECYKEYIATVKRSVPPNRLKVLNLEDGFGWEDICPIIGVPVPKNLDWPGRNTPEEFHQISGAVLKRGAMKTIMGISSVVGGIIAVGVWYRRAGGMLPKLGFLS